MYECNKEVLDAIFKSLTEEQTIELAKLFKNVQLYYNVKGFMAGAVLVGGLALGMKLRKHLNSLANKPHKNEPAKQRG